MLQQLMISSVRPTFYEQKINAAKDWTGAEPGTYPATVADINDGTTNHVHKGGFETLADDVGGKFEFGHRAELLITEIYFNMDTGVSWTLYRCRIDPAAPSAPVKDTIKTGAAGVTHTKQELPALQVGEWLQLESTGGAGGGGTVGSIAKIYVRYSDENVS